MRSNAFIFTQSFDGINPKSLISKLTDAGFSGINLAVNYHASRDFDPKRAGKLIYPNDGFHYYLPNSKAYPKDGLKIPRNSHSADNQLLDSIFSAADKFEINAWAVFLHNSSFFATDPDCYVENIFGTKFQSELCPSNPKVAQYVTGLVTDLADRGFNSISVESLQFHGFDHGEHHERLFLQMSAVTKFLLSLCFCGFCTQKYAGAIELKQSIQAALKPFLADSDPWLDQKLTKPLLSQIVGPAILEYLTARNQTVSELYKKVYEIAQAKNVKIYYEDQAPLINFANSEVLDDSWQIGIDNNQILKHTDAYLPLMYRKEIADFKKLAEHYRKNVTKDLRAIIRPTYPDAETLDNLQTKVEILSSLKVSSIDFYLFDTWREKNLQWVTQALARIA